MAAPLNSPFRLLLFALDGNKPHARPMRRFTNRLGMSRIVLLPFHEWLDIGRRDEPHHTARCRP